MADEDFKDMQKVNIIDRDQGFNRERSGTDEFPIAPSLKSVDSKVEEYKHEVNFDAKNKYEFPQMDKVNNLVSAGADSFNLPRQKRQKPKDGGNAWDNKNPYGYSDIDGKADASIKKKIESDFPTLGLDGNANAGEQADFWQKL
jgi:hypothetical protein